MGIYPTEANVGYPSGQPDPASVNKRAPILLHGRIDIAAAREEVWDVLAAIEDWPDWNPDVSSASPEGSLEPGTTFRWKSGGTSLISRLLRVCRPAEIAWTGRSMGINVVHVYRLEGRGDRTIVRTEESVAGIPARLFRGPIRRRMDVAIQNQLQRLKAEAERRAGAR
jgi:Polyketide cyclase / dehydrase and lipid transport